MKNLAYRAYVIALILMISFLLSACASEPVKLQAADEVIRMVAEVRKSYFSALGANQKGLEEKIRKMIPGYMAMGETGMAEHADHVKHMPGPKNTLPMMMGKGPFGNIEMGGMFTVVKVRDKLQSYDKNPGWYKHPEGTVAYKLKNV